MGSPVIFNSGYAKLLAKTGIKFNDDTLVLTGAVDPSVSNPSAPNGSIYLSSVYGIYQRKNSAWVKIADSEKVIGILATQNFDLAATTDFTQTGLNLVTTNNISGSKSAQLIHQAATTQSFKQVIAVDRKFRGYNNTLSLSVRSSAASANVTLLVYDETNSANLLASTQISTGQITSAVFNTSNASSTVTVTDNSILNQLKVGATITGSGIPSNTVITAVGSGSITISQNATATATGVALKVSLLPSTKSFTFDIPANCASLSYTISALAEAGSPETYIDDVAIVLTSQALSSTSITIPKAVQNEYSASISAAGTLVSQVGNFIQSVVKNSTGNYTITFVSGKFTSIPTFVATANATTGPGATVEVTSISASAVTYQVSHDQVAANDCPVNIVVVKQGNDWIDPLTSTETKTIPLTTAQLVQQSDSAIAVTGGNGFASSFSEIRKFSSISLNIGSDVTYTTSPTLGDSFTINSAGVYNISYTDASSGSGSNTIFILKNSTSVSVAATLAADSTTGSTVEFTSASASAYLNVGDIIRFGCGTPSSVNSTSAYAKASISKAGAIKQLNPSSDSKIFIPTHQLRFEGASSRGATDTAIVKFDTQAITQGDAWDVVNTAANGTVVTVKKAGILSVSTSLSVASGNSVFITKNQANLTAAPASSFETLGVNASDTNSLRTSVSYSGYVNIGDKIRVVIAAASPTANGNNNLNLSLTESSIPANFSNVLPQWSQSDSAVRMDTGNGFGSTNTVVRRFANNPDNLGTAITYTDSATLGASFTINEDGVYAISYTDEGTGNTGVVITKNSSVAVAGNNQLAIDYITTTTPIANASTQVYLSKGDVIRAIAPTPGNITSSVTSAKFSISKVGKPNLTSVDVTPFVNMKTTDVEAIEVTGTTTTFGSTNTGVPVLSITKNTNLGVIRIDSSAANGTSFVALKDCELNLSAVITAASSNGTVSITRNSTVLTATTPDGQVVTENIGTISATMSNINANIVCKAGDTIRLHRHGTGITGFGYVTITATADNNATAAPTQQVSSDTLSFVFKSTAIDPSTDPVGTFNTYRYTANSNTTTINTTAPTQSVSSMNINGIRIWARPYNGTTNGSDPSNEPTKFDIFIGKGLKSWSIDAYNGAAKTIPDSVDWTQVSSTIAFGAFKYYNEVTGILTIDAGYNLLASTTTHNIGAANGTSDYFVFNASKSPSLVTIPNLAPRIATISHELSSGTSPGTVTAGSWQTHPLNTLVDSTGIVTSLASNAFTLPAGEYDIVGHMLLYRTGAGSCKLRNTTDSTDVILGSPVYSESTTVQNSNTMIFGRVVITSPKTFEFQAKTDTTKTTDGWGRQSSNGVNDVFAQIRITKIK
jgi:hypothetical protein